MFLGKYYAKVKTYAVSRMWHLTVGTQTCANLFSAWDRTPDLNWEWSSGTVYCIEYYRLPIVHVNVVRTIIQLYTVKIIRAAGMINWVPQFTVIVHFYVTETFHGTKTTRQPAQQLFICLDYNIFEPGLAISVTCVCMNVCTYVLICLAQHLTTTTVTLAPSLVQLQIPIRLMCSEWVQYAMGSSINDVMLRWKEGVHIIVTMWRRGRGWKILWCHTRHIYGKA